MRAGKNVYSDKFFATDLNEVKSHFSLIMICGYHPVLNLQTLSINARFYHHRTTARWRYLITVILFPGLLDNCRRICVLICANIRVFVRVC